MNVQILAVDIGTTNMKVGLVDIDSFKVIYKVSEKTNIIYPRHGWAEQDPEELWWKVSKLIRKLLSEADGWEINIKGIIYTAHMAGVLPLDKDGNPLRNIIIWLDERAAGLPKDIWKGIIKISGYNIFKLINFLRVTGGAPSKTGKDPISKILWIREYERDIYRKTAIFSDVKGYLIYRSTGNVITSPDEAHLTWLADTRNKFAAWYKPLLRKYGLSENHFPKIYESVSIAGYLTDDAANDLGLKANIPVIVGSGDLTAAAIGSGAVAEGEPHIYIGTSNWIAAHINKRKVDVLHYIGSLLSGIPNKYLLIAEQEVAGAALDWAIEFLKIDGGNYKHVENLVKSSTPGANKLIFLPWMYGERSPIDDPYVRGALINLSFLHGDKDILRAIMEGVALNIRWAYKYFKRLIKPADMINVVGGGVSSDTWCQILADTLNIKIRRLLDPQDAGLRGSSTIAAVALNIYKSFESAVKRYSYDRVFRPDENNVKIYNNLYKNFVQLYSKTKGIFRELNMSIYK